jgi:hypothetical protein
VRDRVQPPRRVVRDAAGTPGLDGLHQRILNRVVGAIDVAIPGREESEHVPALLASQRGERVSDFVGQV